MQIILVCIYKFKTVSMKKFFLGLILSVFILSSTSIVVFAYTLSPSSGSYNPGSSFTIQVLAQPNGANQNAVTIRLSATNLTITNFVPVTGGSWVGATADCAGSTYFTATTVCTSLAKSTNITAGEVLGTISVTLGSTAGAATFTKTSGSAYSDGITATPDVGGVASYTVTGSSGGGLPNTAIGDPQSNLVIAISGILIILGIGIFFLQKKNTIVNADL